MQSNNIKIYFFLALGLLMFGIAPILVRLAGTDANPISITTIRTVSAVLMLAPFWIYSHLKKGSWFQFDRREMGWSILGGVALAMHFTLWISSLKFTSVASASVLVTTHPILLIIIESVFLKKKFSVITWTGVLIAFSGSLLLGFSDTNPGETYSNPVLGNILAFTASLLFVVYILISQKIRRNSGWLDYVFKVYFFTAITTVGIFFIFKTPFESMTIPVFWAGIGLAVGAQIIGHGSLNFAVKTISATLLSTLILAEPVLATFLALVIFSEVPVLLSMTAMLLILAGIVTGWWGRRLVSAD